MMTSDGLFGNTFPAFEGGFTALDFPEPPSIFPYYDELLVFSPIQNQEPVLSNSGSDNWNPITTLDSNSGSDESNLKNQNPSFGSDDIKPPIEPVSVINERKRRRMVSNRESARRSRMRKQTHLENLRNQLNRLRVTNRELMNRVRLATHHCQIVSIDNDRLSSESVVLRQRLSDIRQQFLLRQLQQQLITSAWPCNNFTVLPMNDETTINPQPLIT